MPTPSNIDWLMDRASVCGYAALHAWSVQDREAYWQAVVERLQIPFRKRFERILDISAGVEQAKWLCGAELNIAESCFLAPPDSTAIVHQKEGGTLRSTTVAELRQLTDRVANGLSARGFQPGDAIGMLLPITVEAVAVYLGIIKAGCVAVGIADSFSAAEIAVRVKISRAVALFTQDVIHRGGKTLPLYDRAVAADAPPAVVLPAGDSLSVDLREGDLAWESFAQDGRAAESVIRGPDDPMTILFSSGTTAEPKAIPWKHATPIKCAADGHFHHNIRPGDVVTWPTSMGWMMGPWLIFAGLMNRATVGIFDGSPICREFAEFVRDSHTSLLGVTPSLVKAWRTSKATDGVDWTTIERFSSTGECSGADDMQWLMDRAGGKPVIEYCGGTEIAGGYITSTMSLPCRPGTFNAPALGLGMVLLDECGKPANPGEVFLIPPSIGLSTELLNADHHAVYHADTPPGPNGETLRRHGDLIERLPGGEWRALGRADDTMNLGGIKVGSAEIERVAARVGGVAECAAVAIAPAGGPSLLVVFAVLAQGTDYDESGLLASIRRAIRDELNPLFKVHALITLPALPRTASNKIMRRVLRDKALANFNAND